MDFFKKFINGVKFYSSLGKQIKDIKIFKVEAQLVVCELISDIFVFNKDSINSETVAQIFEIFIGKFPIFKKADTQFSKAFVITHPYCDLLAGKLNNDFGQDCHGIEASHDQLLNATRPDIIIHSAR